MGFCIFLSCSFPFLSTSKTISQKSPPKRWNISESPPTRHWMSVKLHFSTHTHTHTYHHNKHKHLSIFKNFNPFARSLETLKTWAEWKSMLWLAPIHIFHSWGLAKQKPPPITRYYPPTNLQFFGSCPKGSNTLPKTNSSPLKIGLPKRKVVSQPPFFTGYVSFRECKSQIPRGLVGV